MLKFPEVLFSVSNIVNKHFNAASQKDRAMKRNHPGLKTGLWIIMAIVSADDTSVAEISDSDKGTLSKVISTWRERQSQLNTLHVKWTTEITILADTIRILPQQGLTGFTAGPPQDVTYQQQHDLMVNQQSSTIATSGKIIEPRNGSLTDFTDTSLFDGSITASRIVLPSNEHGVGVLEETPHHRAFLNIHCQPLAQFFWPLNRDMGGFAAENLSMTGQSLIINGHECLVIKHMSLYSPQAYQLLYVDNSSNNVIRRVERIGRQGDVLSQTDTEYSESDDGPSPSHWECRRFKNDRLASIYMCELTELERNSITGPAFETADIDYQPGDVVTDLRGAAHEKLVMNEAGDLVPFPGAMGETHRNWWLVLICVAFATVTWHFTMRKRT